MQVESAGRCHCAAVGDGYRAGGDEVRRHSDQPDDHPSHASAAHRARCVVAGAAATELATVLVVIAYMENSLRRTC